MYFEHRLSTRFPLFLQLWRPLAKYAAVESGDAVQRTAEESNYRDDEFREEAL